MYFQISDASHHNSQCVDCFQTEKKPEEPHSLRKLFGEIVKSGAGVVFHNAMLDLVFLYKSFWAEPASTISTFAADLIQVVSLYDICSVNILFNYLFHT